MLLYPQKQFIIWAISRHASLDYGATSKGKSVMPGTRLLTGWQNNRGLILCRGENGISSPKRIDLQRDQHSLILNAVSPEVKRLERDADHSPPSNAEVKTEWSYISVSLCAFMTGTGKFLPLPCLEWYDGESTKTSKMWKRIIETLLCAAEDTTLL